MNLTKCDAVKLESNDKNFDIINELVKANIPVMGHIGYTPQFKNKFMVEGDTNAKVKKLLKEAELIQKAGAFSIVLECLTPKASKIITKNLKIVIIRISHFPSRNNFFFIINYFITSAKKNYFRFFFDFNFFNSQCCKCH